MFYKYLLLLLSFSAFADPITITFQPPTERVDETPLADSEITEYKYDAISATNNANTVKDVVFANTGNMTYHTLELTKDRYIICMYAKATYWSNPRCTFINMFEPKPPLMC